MEIYSFEDFLNKINEGLIKTHDINLVINSSYRNLSVIRLPFNIIQLSNNTIKLTIQNINSSIDIKTTFKVLEKNFINLFGWFPSYMYMTNTQGMQKQTSYDEIYLIKNYKSLTEISIIYESKFDKSSHIPNKLYHISIQEYEDKILKYGLYPKSKNKMSIHDNRIYVYKSPQDCYDLIPNLKMWYYGKKKLNTKWIIYEIDPNKIDKLYNDPNFINKGYYTLNNIKSENISIFDKE
jgi:hypothetical protein